MRLALRYVLAAMVAVSLCFTSTPVFAGTTGSIQGTVTDSATHAPIAGVRVTAKAPSGTVTATTNGRGFYSLLGLLPDTYTLSFELQGYTPGNLTGISVFADQSQPANESLEKSLVTIAKVTSRPSTGAFQPGVPQDTYTVNAAGIQQALGTTLNVSATQLFTSLPGVTSAGTAGGVPTIRAGRANTIGYTLQGSPTTNAYNGTFGAAQLQDEAFNFDVLDNVPTLALKELQLTPGVADASYGDAGTGNINLVFKNGTFPGIFDASQGIGGNGFNHALNSEYGIASPNGRYSAYFMFHGGNSYNNWGDGAVSKQAGTYQYPGLTVDRTFLANLGYKWGKNNKYGLSLFALQEYDAMNTDYGEDPSTICAPTCIGTELAPGFNICPFMAVDNTPFLPAAQQPINSLNGFVEQPYCQALIALYPGQTENNLNGSLASMHIGARAEDYPHYNEGISFTDRLSDSAYLTLHAFHSGGYETDSQADNGGNPYFTQKGGGQSGFSLDFNKQIGEHHSLQFGAGHEYQHPVNTLNFPLWGPEIAVNTIAMEMWDFIPQGYGNNNVNGETMFGGATYSGPNCSANFEAQEFGAPASNQNWCGYLENVTGAKVLQVPGNTVQNNVYPKFTNAYIRDTWRPSDNLTLDLGVRLDHAAYGFPKAALDPTTCTSLYQPISYQYPTDAQGNYVSIVPGKTCPTETFADVSAANNPTVIQPRIALSWKIKNDDAIKAAYGRSFSWVPLTLMDPGMTDPNTGGAALANVPAYLSPIQYCMNTAPIWQGAAFYSDSRCASQATFDANFKPGVSIPFYSYYNPFPCTGTIGTNAAGDQTCSTNANYPNPPAGQVNPAGPGFCGRSPYFVPCVSYAEQLRWQYANDWCGQMYWTGCAVGSGEIDPIKPSTYSNYELSWNHLFRQGIGKGWLKSLTEGTGLSVTAWKRNSMDESLGEDIPFTGKLPPTDAVLENYAPFATSNFTEHVLTNNGLSYANGIELRLTHEREYGLSVQLSGTFQRAVTNTPATGLYSGLYNPSTGGAAAALNLLYNNTYIPPVTTVTSLSYRTHSGWRFGLQTQWANGYPIGSGLFAPQFVDGTAMLVPNTNIDASGTPMQYVDPFNPGSVTHPHIAATSGTSEGRYAFAAHTAPQSNTNVQIEKDLSHEMTLGLNINNVFGYDESGPITNQSYQPVATGISGPLSGASSCTSQCAPVYVRNGNQPYFSLPNSLGRTFYLYLTLKHL